MAERRAARDLLHVSNMRHTRSIVDPRVGGDDDDDDDEDASSSFWTHGDEESADDDAMTLADKSMLQEAATRSELRIEEQQALIQSSDEGTIIETSYGATPPPLLPRINHPSGSGSVRKSAAGGGSFSIQPSLKQSQNTGSSGHRGGLVAHFIQQSSAVAVVAMLNMMISIPFGASYFPIGWKADSGEGEDDVDDEDDVSGNFPLPGKQALGMSGTRCK
jgi:hypothetical protein